MSDRNNRLFGGEVSKANQMPAHLHHLLRGIKLKASFWHYLLPITWKDWVYVCQNIYAKIPIQASLISPIYKRHALLLLAT